MKRSALFLVIGIVIGVAFVVAEDFQTPHTFKAGDVISADVLNEVFDRIKESERAISSADLLGTWTLTACTRYFTGVAVDAAWEADPDQLTWTMEGGIITFTDDGDGTYSLSTSSPSPFWLETTPALNSTPFTVVNDCLIFKEQSHGDGVQSYHVRFAGPTRFILMNQAASNNQTSMIVCDKQHIPPPIPTKLSATADGLTVTLSWTDTAADETGFKIMRRDTLTGQYAEVGTAAADATTYEDTLTTAGTYWYRVRATNANGDSLGSNVVKVAVEAPAAKP